MSFVRMAAPKADDPASSPMGRSPSDAVTGKSQRGAGAFDLWLQRGLHKLFDDVANEPVPDELLRLIEEDRKDR